MKERQQLFLPSFTGPVIYTFVPGQRAKGQKLIPVQMSENFIESIDRAFRILGFDDRSKFIREAVKEKLMREGYPVDNDDALAPSRVRYRIQRERAALNEEKPNSKPPSDDKVFVKKALAAPAGKRGAK